MAFDLPQKRIQLRQIQTQKRQVPLEQILAAESVNPLAAGIETLGSAVGGALTKRAQLRAQGEQLARLEQLGGYNQGELAGLDPSTASSFATSNIKQQAATKAEAQKLAGDILKVRALEQQFGYKPGELGDDHSAALLKVQFDNQEKLRNTAAARETQDRKKEEFMDKQVNKYSSALEKTGVPNAIGTAENVLNKLPERGVDIPGYGVLDSLVPNWAAGQKTRDMRQAVSQLFNVELKTRSGAAVTDPELNRLREEFGAGKMATEESLRSGILQFLTRARELGINVEAGFSPDVRSVYQEQGGRDVGGTFNSLIGLEKINPAKPKPIMPATVDGYVIKVKKK